MEQIFQYEGYALHNNISDNAVNVVYINVGHMPQIKVLQHIKQFSDEFHALNPEYTCLFIPHFDNPICKDHQLVNDRINIVYIPVGKSTKTNQAIYMKEIIKDFKTNNPNIKLFLFPVTE